MRIAYVSYFEGPYMLAQRKRQTPMFPGAHQKILTLARAMLKAGYEIEILSPGAAISGSGRWYEACSETLLFDEGSVEVRYCPQLDMRLVQRCVSLWHLPRLIITEHARKPIDRMMIYNIGEVMFYAAATAHKLGIPVILEYEDDAVMIREPDENALLLQKIRNKLNELYCRYYLSKINRLIRGALLVCPELAKDLSTDNTAVIRGALSTDITKATQSLPPKFEHPPIRLAYAGALSKDKGPDLLIDSLFHIGFPVEVNIYGSGPLENFLHQRAREVPEHHQVVIHGYVDRKKLLEGLMSAHILINPHRMDECHLQGSVFPFKIIEYAATGIPIVSSGLGQIEEGIASAIYIYDEDTPTALATAVKNVADRYEMMRKAALITREYVRNRFDTDALAKTIINVMENASYGGIS